MFIACKVVTYEIVWERYKGDIVSLWHFWFGTKRYKGSFCFELSSFYCYPALGYSWTDNRKYCILYLRLLIIIVPECMPRSQCCIILKKALSLPTSKRSIFETLGWIKVIREHSWKSISVYWRKQAFPRCCVLQISVPEIFLRGAHYIKNSGVHKSILF